MGLTPLTYAIGDIHGRSDLLRQALAWIDADAGQRPIRVVFIGDYIDRGPEARSVVEILMRGPQRPGHEWVPLRGNHEAMLVAACSDPKPNAVWHWFVNGGIETLKSYEPGWHVRRSASPRDVVPAEHIAFLRSLPCRFEDEARIFVHAGLRPGVAAEEQNEEDMLWIRNEFLSSNHDFGKLVVHGHTPTAGLPELLSNRLNLDTGAVWSGHLTVAAFHPNTLYPCFFQTQVSDPAGQPETEVLRMAADHMATLINMSDEAATALTEAIMTLCAMKVRDLRGDEAARNILARLYGRMTGD